MKSKVIQAHKNYKPRLVRWECSCGYEESQERTLERLSNDALDNEVKETRRLEKESLLLDKSEERTSWENQ